jgi:hypothetical protein
MLKTYEEKSSRATHGIAYLQVPVNRIMLSYSIGISMAPLTKTIKEITEKADNVVTQQATTTSGGGGEARRNDIP